MKNKDDILEYLKTTPIVQVACQKAGINKSTYYRWLKEDGEFKKQVNKAKKQGVSFVNDLAEAQLITLIKEKHPTSIFYWLNHHKYPYFDKEVLLNPKETKKLIDTVISFEPISGYKLLLEKSVQRKIPRFLFNMVFSIITKSTKFQQDDIKIMMREIKNLDRNLKTNFGNTKGYSDRPIKIIIEDPKEKNKKLI